MIWFTISFMENIRTSEARAIDLMIGFMDLHPEICCLTKGVDPEEGCLVYYFLNPTYKIGDREFEDELSELDLKIARETGHRCDVLVWPTAYFRGLLAYPFIGEMVYRKQEGN